MKPIKPTFIITVLVLASCTIIPHTTDIPLIREKGDLRIDAGVSVIPTANATISYGLSEKIAVQAYGSYGADNEYYLQTAAGLYKNHNQNLVTEWYLGAGTGNSYTYKDSNPGNLEGNYQIYFTQFNIGKLNSNFLNADYGLGLKAAYERTKFTDMDYFNIYYFEDDFDRLNYPVQTDNGLTFQPTILGRFGKGRLKFSVKASGLLFYQFTNRDNKLPVGYFNIGIGLNYYLSTKRS